MADFLEHFGTETTGVLREVLITVLLLIELLTQDLASVLFRFVNQQYSPSSTSRLKMTELTQAHTIYARSEERIPEMDLNATLSLADKIGQAG